MNATMISPVYPLRGGIAQSGSLLLGVMNPSTQIISYKRQYPKFMFPGKSEFVAGFNEAPYFCKLDALNPLTWLKVARSVKTDVVIIRYWSPALALCIGTIAWLLRKKKIIFIVDNVTPHEKIPFSRFLTKYALRKGKGFLFFSRYVKNDFLKLLPRWDVGRFTEQLYEFLGHDLEGTIPDPCRVKSMPIIDLGEKIISKREAMSILTGGIGSGYEKFILFFGLVREYKGLETLIRALPEILESVQVHLLVVGEFYEDKQKYLNLINELSLWSNITIYDEYVKKVAPYFCAADIVVLPYKSATQSGVVRLAQYFKKPCIVTDVGGLSEMVTYKTGFVTSEYGIADAVIDFYKKDWDWDFSDIPTWDNVVEVIEELTK